MTVLVADVEGTVTNPGPETESRDFILIGDVLEIVRHHPPVARVMEGIEEESEQLSIEHCVVARQKDIQAFHLAGELSWIDYSALIRRVRLQDGAGRTTHISPYAEAEVFAPLKLVIAERPTPIRCVLTYLPVYPWRGMLGLMRPGHHVWMVYAAAAVLNSKWGESLYELLHWAEHGREPSKHGLDKAVLNQIPVARANHRWEDLRAVAELAHQISAIYEAQRECIATFSRQRIDLERRLEDAIPRLLRLSEDRASRLLEFGVYTEEAQSEPLQESLGFLPSDLLPPLPKLPPVELLTPDQRSRLEMLSQLQEVPDAQEEQFERLKQIAFWEEVVNHGLPENLQIGVVEPAA